MTEIEGVVRDLVEKIKRSAGIDTRFVVLDSATKKKGTIVQIDFKASSEFVARAIHKFFEKHKSALGSSVIYTVKVLPTRAGEGNGFAICNVSAAPLRHAPSHKSEQISQFLLGETADILEFDSHHWTRIRLHLDGYVGWVAKDQIVAASNKEFRRWSRAKKVTTQELISGLRERPKRNSYFVREFLLGTYLPLKKISSGWSQIGLPDGSAGWVPSNSIVRLDRRKQIISSEEIVATARKFLGVPYVWGGRSSKGFDSSGFTQTVFRFHGIELPRDASLQWKCGRDVGKKITELVEGDLLFFGGRDNRITHVGIYLGDKDTIVHSSGFVRISSLTPTHRLYDEKLPLTLVGARRLGKDC